MDIRVQFPSDADVIAEEAERFRGLPAPDRLQAIQGVLEAGALMLQNSPRSAFLVEYAEQQEQAFRRSVQEFVARHGS